MTENLCSTKKQDIRRGLIAVFIFLALVLAITAGLFCINAFGAEATESLQIQEKGTSANEATQNLLQGENTSSGLSTIDNLPLKKGSSYVQAANAQEPWLNTSTNNTYTTLNDAVSAAGSGDLTLQNGILLGPCTTQLSVASFLSQNNRESLYNSITSHSRAVYANSGGKVNLNNMTVLQFATTKGDGAVVYADNAELTVTNGSKLGMYTSNKIDSFSSFIGNLARNGGAIYASGSNATVTIEDSSYVYGNICCDNSVTAASGQANPGTSYNYGGAGIYLDSGVTAKISQSYFYTNLALGYGGGIHIYNAGDVEISG